jgi:uncharacterized protein
MKRLLNQLLGGYRLLQQLCLCVTLVVLLTQFLSAPAYATSASEVPKPADGTRVIDQAEVLSRSSEGRISSAFADLAKQTGNQVYVVTIHRLDYDETIDSFAQDLFTAWFPTPATQANQTLLVLDSLTNNAAIRTGDQSKATLTDEIATSVAQETLLAPLKEGDKYNQAFLAATDRLTTVLSGRPDPGPPQIKDNIRVEGTFATPEQTKESNATFWVIGFLVVATIVPMATYYFYAYLQSR